MADISLHPIQSKTRDLGFDAFGITAPDLPLHVTEGLDEYIALQHHGEMEWMETRKVLRKFPKELWPDVKSIIVLGHNYTPSKNPLEKLNQLHLGNISSYALGDDYHDVTKKKLREFAAWLTKEYGCEVKLFVDTAPVMEKPLAELAGLGWQGKHTCLISREHGCWLFLGVVFTNLELNSLPLWGRVGVGAELGTTSPSLSPPPDLPPTGGGNIGSCGTCTRCIDVCPTQAIIAPGKLDARKCIAYLTIEHKGHIPVEYRKAMGNRIFGCDDCLAICPWNKFAETTREAKYQLRESYGSMALEELAVLDDASFRKLFTKSPIKRTGRDRFVRNVCIAMGNTGDKRYLLLLNKLTKDESELVREAAEWAIEHLA